MIQKAIEELQSLGQMPDASDDTISDELIDKFTSLIGSVKRPINKDEAEILITLFPQEALYGVEWSLLSLFESVYGSISLDVYKEIIKKCPSEEWRETLEIRLNNSINKE